MSLSLCCRRSRRLEGSELFILTLELVWDWLAILAKSASGELKASSELSRESARLLAAVNYLPKLLRSTCNGRLLTMILLGSCIALMAFFLYSHIRKGHCLLWGQCSKRKRSKTWQQLRLEESLSGVFQQCHKNVSIKIGRVFSGQPRPMVLAMTKKLQKR